MRDSLSERQLDAITKGNCPDCGHRGFVIGPRGGMSQNIECGGCGKRFNVAQVSWSQRAVFGQRIPSLAEGGSDWTEL